ncbi:uncharacterized protein ACNS7B_023373 [Menidia menidia]
MSVSVVYQTCLLALRARPSAAPASASPSSPALTTLPPKRRCSCYPPEPGHQAGHSSGHQPLRLHEAGRFRAVRCGDEEQRRASPRANAAPRISARKFSLKHKRHENRFVPQEWKQKTHVRGAMLQGALL